MSQKRLDPFAALLRIVRQYRVKYRQGRTAEARQRQSQIQDERSGLAASKHSPGENNPKSGQADNNQRNGKQSKVKNKESKHGYNAQK